MQMIRQHYAGLDYKWHFRFDQPQRLSQPTDIFCLCEERPALVGHQR
jgi:hypothetical protein